MFLSFFIIFICKVSEVTISTIKTVFITKKNKKLSSLLGFIEILIWMKLASTVLNGLNDHPEKMMGYALGYALGIVMGLFIEDLLPFGNITLQVIVDANYSLEVIKGLRNKGYALTSFEGQGMKNKKTMIILHIEKKEKKQIIEILNSFNKPFLISIIDANSLQGAYGIK